MSDQKFTSLTIPNLPIEAKEELKNICKVFNTNIQDFIKNFIFTVTSIDDEKLNAIHSMNNVFLENNKDIIDSFIEYREPEYSMVPIDRKEYYRRIYVILNPSYIFDCIKKYFNEE